MPVRELSESELAQVQRVRVLSDEETAQIEPSGVAGDLALSAGGGFLRGVANIVGLPADAANKLAEVSGLGDVLGASPDPIGGSQSIQRGIASLGGPQPGEELPAPGVARVGEEVGAASVPFGIVGGIARTARKGNMIIRPILESFRQAPKTTAAVEAGSAVGAGAGAAIAQGVAPESPGAEIVGQLLGGFASPIAVTSRSIPGISGVRRVAGAFTPGGARRGATERLTNIVEDPEAAAAALAGPRRGVGELTPAQETGDQGLLRVERALMAKDPEIEDRVLAARAATREAAEDAAQEVGSDVPIDRARDFFEDRLERLNQAIGLRASQALESAQRRAANISESQAKRGEASRIVRDEIEGALEDMRVQERALWSEVDEGVQTSTRSLKSTFARIKAGRKKADDPEDIPVFVQRFLDKGGAFGDTESLGDVQTLRSRVLRASREERAKDAPNRRKLDILNEVQSAALDDMGAAPGGENLNVALNFSRELNERFRQGPVGRVLGFERRGGVSTAPEVTLERFLAQQGAQGGANLAALEQAFADSPQRAAQFRGAAQDFVRARFAQQTIDDAGRVRPSAADRFVRNNRELLDNFPELRAELTGAESAQRAADRIAEVAGIRQRGLFDKRQSRAALFLDAPVDQEIKRVLRSREPVANMRQIVQQAKKDPEALKGIKGQFVREIMDRATGANPGRSVDEFLQSNSKVMRQTGLFSPGEVRRLDQITDTLKRLDTQGVRSRDIDALIDSKPDMLIDLLSRIAGANIGARGAAGTTGAPIVAAGAGSRFVRGITNKIPMARTRDVLAEAVLDRDLMRTLLQNVDSPAKQQALQRRLNAFLVNLLPADEQPQQQDQQEQP